MKRITILALAILGAVTAAQAGELAGVKVPDTVTLGGQELVLNGMGLREKMWVDVYVGALYLQEKTSSADQVIGAAGPSRMEMHFVHDAPAEKIIAAWNEGFEDNNSAEEYKAVKERITAFNEFFGADVKEGDVMVFDMVPGEGTTVSINGEVKGVIEGDDFAKALRAIWVGRNPPTKNLKKGLLGGD